MADVTGQAELVEGDIAHDAVDTGFPIKIGGKAESTEPTAVADADRVDAWFDLVGRLATFPGYEMKSAVINCAASGDNTIVAAVSGKKIAVYAILLTANGTVNVRFEDGAGGTAKTGVVELQAREGYAIAVSPPAYLFIGTANTLLNLELSAAIGVDGFVSYMEIA